VAQAWRCLSRFNSIQMAPKRSTIASSPRKAPPAKRSKKDAPEAPLLSFIREVKDIPKPCRDMLVAAVPICLEVVEADRHKFQTEVLNRVAAMIKETEGKKRDAVTGCTGDLAQLTSDKDKAFADAEAKKSVATSKENECKEQEKVVDAATEVMRAAEQALTTAQQNQEAFNNKKAALFTEQDNFAKLLSDSFQPLKDGTHAWNGTQRNKQVSLVKKKLLELGAQESLADALVVALKDKPEKREGAFAKATMQFTEEAFTKHTAQVAQDIASLDPEAAVFAATIADTEAALAEKKAALQVVQTAWDATQDVWLQLEKDSGEAASALKKIECEIPNAMQFIDFAQAALDKFLEIPALFLKLREHSTAVAEDPDEEAEEDKDMGADAGEAEVADDATA